MNVARRGIVTALVKVREVPLPLTVLARRGAVADVFFSSFFLLSLSVARSQGLEVEAGAPVALARGFSTKEATATSEGESPVAHCTIYTPARSASQQGMGNTVFAKGNAMWRIEFETQAKWENPLMGWTSTADPRENVGRMTLAFDTKVRPRLGLPNNAPTPYHFDLSLSLSSPKRQQYP